MMAASRLAAFRAPSARRSAIDFKIAQSELIYAAGLGYPCPCRELEA